MKLTAATITDEQIRELFYAHEIAAIELTVATLPGWSTEDRLETRARCAELFNARTKKRGACCTRCGGPIDEDEECRC